MTKQRDPDHPSTPGTSNPDVPDDEPIEGPDPQIPDPDENAEHGVNTDADKGDDDPA